MPPSPQQVEPLSLDLSLAAQFAAWAMLDEVMQRLAADGYGDTRFADGVVFQHLIDGARTVTDLSGRLGVTQQAASKTVADLRKRGYVVTHRDPNDARALLVGLSGRGESIVQTTRRYRADVNAEVSARLGRRRVADTRETLIDVIQALGLEPALRSRRMRPPGLTPPPQPTDYETEHVVADEAGQRRRRQPLK